jgi:hypothetical protein
MPNFTYIAPPRNQKGGHTRLRVRGFQFGRLEKGYNYFPVPVASQINQYSFVMVIGMDE